MALRYCKERGALIVGITNTGANKLKIKQLLMGQFGQLNFMSYSHWEGINNKIETVLSKITMCMQ